MEILFLVIFLLILASLHFKSPTHCVCCYLLFYTSFWGFGSTEVLVSGTDVGTFAINITLAILLFFKCGYSICFDKLTRFSIAFFLVFYFYGLIKPVYDGNQNILMSIKASKSFLTYIFFFYLLLFRKYLDFNVIFRFFILTSLYFSSLYLLEIAGVKLVPPFYAKATTLQCHFDSFLPFSIILLFYYNYIGESSNYWKLKVLVLCLGVILSGYFSLAVTTLCAIAVLSFYKKTISLSQTAFLCLFLLMFVLAFVLIFYDSDWFLDIVKGQFNSLISRDKYNEYRWQIINANFLGGVGFLYKSSSLLRSFGGTGYKETLSFIDAGYVDLLGRFGVIGLLLFLFDPFKILFNSLRFPYLFPFTFLIIQFVAVNYTWSVFSYPMGILVLSLVYVFVINELDMYKNYG